MNWPYSASLTLESYAKTYAARSGADAWSNAMPNTRSACNFLRQVTSQSNRTFGWPHSTARRHDPEASNGIRPRSDQSSTGLDGWRGGPSMHSFSGGELGDPNPQGRPQAKQSLFQMEFISAPAKTSVGFECFKTTDSTRRRLTGHRNVKSRHGSDTTQFRLQFFRPIRSLTQVSPYHFPVDYCQLLFMLGR